jgi:hypothetical protein
VSVYATPYLIQYYDSNYNKIQKGFKLTVRALLGYRFEFFNRRLYLGPSIEFNYWPVNINAPESFKAVEDKFSNYSLFSPNLYFGYKF